MRKVLMPLLMCLHSYVQGGVIEAYGVIKPTQSVPGVGLIHLRERDGLEVEGYCSLDERTTSLVVSLWSTESMDQPFGCAGAHFSEQSSSLVVPSKEICRLGQFLPAKEGYNEVSLRIDNLSLADLHAQNLSVLVHPPEGVASSTTKNLKEPTYSMIELRWIED